MRAKRRAFEMVVVPTLRGLSNSKLADALARTALVYLDMHRGFSYDMTSNGELGLIDTCVANSRSSGRPFVFFDVGANHGDWTGEVLTSLQGNSNTSGHVFDVSARMAEILMQRFDHDPQLSINHLALSSSEGPVEYKRFPDAEAVNTLLIDSEFWQALSSETELSPGITGDSYCDQKDIGYIDLLKIDTEGWEWHVIQGFSRMLQEHRVGVIQFEYGYTHGDSGFLMRDFFEHFQQLGYVVGPLRKRGVTFRAFKYTDNDFRSGPNYVAALPAYARVLSQFRAE